MEVHLDRIAQLSRGEAALQPFKDRAGMRSAKALLLFLLRPTLEGVRSWDAEEEQNAGREVRDLAGIMAGLVSGYGGLPVELRASPLLDALLDWAAAGLQPSDVQPAPRPAVEVVPDKGSVKDRSPGEAIKSVVKTDSDSPVAAAEPRARLERAVADGDHEQPLALGQQLGWSDVQRLVILAPDFHVSLRGRNVEVSFPPGVSPEVHLVEDRFLERLADLSDVALEEVLRAREDGSTRPKAPRRRGSRAGGTKQKQASERVDDLGSLEHGDTAVQHP